MAIPVNSRRLAAIEGSRGVAASAVILYHAARHLHFAYGVPKFMDIFQFGHAGVDLFFVISGFIILFVHYDEIGHPERARRYLWRRFSRIMPIYWVALALTVTLSVAGGHPFPNFFRLFWSATLLPSQQWPLLDVAWTLQFEMTFYAVFWLLILNRTAGMVTLAFWSIWIILATLGTSVGGGLPSSLYSTYNFEFLFGMAVAYWLKNHRLHRPKLILAIGATLFCAAALAEDVHLMNGYASLSRFVYGPAAALIVLGAAESSRSNEIIVPKILQTLGAASYTIYLFQFVFIGVLWELWLAAGLDARTPHLASFPFLVAFAIVGGVATSWLLEYPLMRMMRSSRLPTAATADAT